MLELWWVPMFCGLIGLPTVFWMTAVGNGPVDTIDDAYPWAGAAAICMGMWEGRLEFVPWNNIGDITLSPLSTE